jgi:hypothetical protein
MSSSSSAETLPTGWIFLTPSGPSSTLDAKYSTPWSLYRGDLTNVGSTTPDSPFMARMSELAKRAPAGAERSVSDATGPSERTWEEREDGGSRRAGGRNEGRKERGGVSQKDNGAIGGIQGMFCGNVETISTHRSPWRGWPSRYPPWPGRPLRGVSEAQRSGERSVKYSPSPPNWMRFTRSLYACPLTSLP